MTEYVQSVLKHRHCKVFNVEHSTASSDFEEGP